MSGETDQVKWRGVRPVDGIRGIWPERNATRVHPWYYTTTSGYFVVYTVPAGKLLFVSNSVLTSKNLIDQSGSAAIWVRDAADANQYVVDGHNYVLKGHTTSGFMFSPGLELPAGWDIAVRCDLTNMAATAIIHGWLETA